MTTNYRCSGCGQPIASLRTAMRSGRCSDCCRVASEDERAQLKWLEWIETLPIPDLLKLLDEAVLQAAGAAATDAVARLGPERVYGFILQHYIFRNCFVAVLTEDQRERSVRDFEKRWPNSPGSGLDRWSPVDCGYIYFRDDLFDRVGYLLGPLEDRQQEDEVAKIFIRAMRHVREHIITDPRVVLTIMDYTEYPPGYPFYAHAELFNDAATLARLKEELGRNLEPSPFWDLLEFARSRIPKG